MSYHLSVESEEILSVELQGNLAHWLDRPTRYMDWWEMRPYPVADFLKLIRQLSAPISAEETTLSVEDKEVVLDGIEQIRKQCEESLLPLSADHLSRVAEAVRRGSTVPEVESLIPELMNRIEDESKRHVVMMIDDHAAWFKNAQFFDAEDPKANKVSDQFPSAAEDIAEAGKCIACNRGTACVMHLVRVLEVGLRVLGAAVGVPPQNDWGRYLEKIDKELQLRFATSGARSPDEQFYAEAHVTFDGVRRAWRNPTMHVEKTYTVERAEEILIAARSFMRHLATRLSE